MQGKYRQDYAVVKRYGVSGLEKLVYFKTPVRQKDAGPVKRGEGGGEKLDNNIARARAVVKELALCNEWELFGSFTLSPEKYDRDDLALFRKDFSQFLRDCRKKYGGKWQYLLIPEPHEKGGWHMHGLLGGVPSIALRPFSVDENIPERLKKSIREGCAIYDCEAYRRRFGWVTLSPIRDKVACSSYIVKYISKDLTKRAESVGQHLYYASQGLARAEKIYEGSVLLKECDYENDYVKILWSNGENYGDVVYLD